jgi:GntR family transcriptional regulator
VIDRRGDRALYRQIADELRDGIRSGRHAAGAPLPSEAALMERYGTSQGTVRKALGQLRAEGLTVSEKGRGVFVRDQPPVLRMGNGTLGTPAGRGIGDVALHAGAATDTCARTCDSEAEGPLRAPEDVALRLDLPSDERVLVWRCRYRADGEAVQLATSYVPWRVAKLIPPPLLADAGSVYAGIEQAGFRLGRFEEELGARPARPEDADGLGLIGGEPVIVLTRVAYDITGRPVELSHRVMVAHRYRFAYRFPVR